MSTIWNTFTDAPTVTIPEQPPPVPPPVPILAVGLAGIYGSQDGVNWSHKPAPYDSTYPHNGYLCCTYASHLRLWIVGTGYNGTAPHAIIISEDGNSWNTVNTPWDGLAEVWALAYSPVLQLIVAIANGRSAIDEQIMTSDDGETWTVRPSYWDFSGIGGDPEDVGWIPFLNEFVLVADASRPSGGPATTQGIGTSPDGINWTPQDSPVDPVPFGTPHPNVLFMFGVNHSDDTVFALGSFDSSPSDVELYSSDGSSWTLNVEGSTPYNVYDLAYRPGSFPVYIRGTNASSFSIQYSLDGLSWTSVPGTVALVNYINKCLWSPTANKFIAVGGDFSPGLMTSVDGSSGWATHGVGMMFDVWDYAAS